MIAAQTVRRVLLGAFVGISIAVTALWLVGQCWRDTTLTTALCFYIPSPVLAVMSAAVAIACRRAGWTRLAPLMTGLVVMPLLAVSWLDNQWTQPKNLEATTGTPLRVVHWNVMWGKRGWPAVARQLAELDADAYVLSEAATDFDYSAFEGYQVSGDWSMVIVARGELGPLGRRFNKAEIRELWIDWRPPLSPKDQPPLRVMLVDISAQIEFHRQPTIRLFRETVAELRPDLVMGDFNSPRRSIGLTPPPAGYRHAYDAVGEGWSYTWPVPAPVLAIDQTLFGQRLLPKRYRLQTSWLSDHRRQVFDAELVAPRVAR